MGSTGDAVDTVARRPNRGPRAAAANRAALLAAAEELFGELGYQAPLHLIAQRAGVGQGSLYRHFTDRIGLAAAVMEHRLADFVAFAADPAVGVEQFLDRIGSTAVASAPLIEMVLADAHDPRVARLRRALDDTIARVFERDRHRLSPDATPDHLALAVHLVPRAVARVPAEERAATRERILDLMLAGLRGVQPRDPAAALGAPAPTTPENDLGLSDAPVHTGPGAPQRASNKNTKE